MSYLVLARKYRPKDFTELVGQSHIGEVLKNAIEKNRIAHAYLFSGPRGTGKTTTARILAKALNCIKGPNTNSCNKCENCIEIADGNSIDVLEIDFGAGNTAAENALLARLYAEGDIDYEACVWTQSTEDIVANGPGGMEYMGRDITNELYGYQLHYCDWILIKLWIHIPQYWDDGTATDDLMNLEADFTASLGVIQWNEFVAG